MPVFPLVGSCGGGRDASDSRWGVEGAWEGGEYTYDTHNENGEAWGYQASLLGVLNHVFTNPILDRATRFHYLELARDPREGLGPGHSIQKDHRSVSHQIRDVGGYSHSCWLSQSRSFDGPLAMQAPTDTFHGWSIRA